MHPPLPSSPSPCVSPPSGFLSEAQEAGGKGSPELTNGRSAEPEAAAPEEDSPASPAKEAEPHCSTASDRQVTAESSPRSKSSSLLSFFRFSRSNKKKGSPMKKAGLPNIGNTCFMNATLQGVFSLSSFCSDIMRQEALWSPKRKTTLKLQRYVGELYKARQGQCSYKGKCRLLWSIMSSVAEYNEEYYDFSEQDAHEFLMFFLMRMKMEGETLQAAAMSPQYICPVQNLEFKLQCVRTCSSCADKVYLEEEHNSLSLDRKPSLTDSMNLYFQAPELECTCQQCSGKQATVVRTFLTLPRVLVLHLKRFQQDGEEMEKASGAVTIPPVMSVASLCGKQEEEPEMDTPGESVLEDEESSQPKTFPRTASVEHLDESGDREREQQALSVKFDSDQTMYHLTGVVSHLGESLDSGHYVSDIEDHGRGWFTLNDSRVRETDEATVLEKRKDTAYLLFYVLCEEDEGDYSLAS